MFSKEHFQMLSIPQETLPNDLSLACRILEKEVSGLNCLADQLKDATSALSLAFQNVIALFSSLTGRVIVTGIGKSGHIGKKIQATLASTGTPSLFVHPSEASHGDLGMLLKGDAVLALSASGETTELGHIITHARRFGMPLISITFNEYSTLAKASNICLPLPKAAEACPMGLAPTTTSLMQLAMGDAIAIVLLQRKGFSANDFGIFHPGGRLGTQLLVVNDLMHKGDSLPLVKKQTPMHHAIVEMTQKAFGCLGVIDDHGTLQGIITDGDLRRVLNTNLANLQTLHAEKVMNTDPLTVHSSMLAADALRIMNERVHPVTCLFIIDEARQPIGIVHIHDLLRAGIA